MQVRSVSSCLGVSVLAVICVLLAGSAAANTISVVASTVPANGDVNPYGIVQVPATVGKLTAGNILVSNFNSIANLQGTGTTIVQITPQGAVSLFAEVNAHKLPGACPGGVGLTTALAVLKTGWVIVGSLPTTDGTSTTAQAGCLVVIDSNGNVVETFSNSLINGPWDMTASDQGSTATLFFTNVLNGTVAGGGKVVHDGTVVRLDLAINGSSAPAEVSYTVIGSGFSERTDPAALVIGPTGVGLSADGNTLYVADSLNNRVASISNPLTRTTSAKTGTTLSSAGFLNDPLGLTIGVTGNVLTTNGNDGYVVETTPAGVQRSRTMLDSSGDPPGAGALFGLVVVKGQGIYYVDDATNTLNLLH